MTPDASERPRDAGPRVSVVLPTYNGSRYLREAAGSVLAQTLRDLELILVDDASTDATPDMVREIAASDARVRTARHPSNRRLPAALNTGMGLARGALLTWTSDDNLYRPEALETMADALARDPAVDVVYADATVIDAEGRPLRPWRTGAAEDLPYRNPVGACFLYRRHVHEALGGYAEDLFLLEDYDFWLRAACRFRMARIPRDLYLYRVHGGSLSARAHRARDSLAKTCITRALDGMPRRMRARAHAHLASILRRERDRVGACRQGLASLATAPSEFARYCMRRFDGTRLG